ncbi:MAG: response regulator [Chloroflexi bacterium]|nr:response regulator [Chloroflexota bacterium]
MGTIKSKIMVVDDEPRMLSTITVILEDAGYDVYGVDDGYKAIELASSENFSLVFMDINLPGMDGLEAFRQVKSFSPGTPVIMMTGYSVEDLIRQALEEGAYTVLYKPFNVDRLLVAVDGVLDAPCVLVLDDDESGDRKSVKSTVENLGYRASVASNGEQAIAQVESKDYDIILMNVGSPGPMAFEDCRQIVRSNPSAKVIVVSDHKVNAFARQALVAGAFSMLGKPVEPADMFALVDSLVSSTDDATPVPDGILADTSYDDNCVKAA